MPKQKKKPHRAGKIRQQFAALPVRTDHEGRLQVLLLTSRGTGRWIIPKGWPMRKRSPGSAAAREAFEEAGLEGTIEGDAPIGHYSYEKGMDGGGKTSVRVGVFLLTVARQLSTWPEQAQRETRWCDPDEAAGLVAEPELADLLRHIGARDRSEHVTGAGAHEGGHS